MLPLIRSPRLARAYAIPTTSAPTRLAASSPASPFTVFDRNLKRAQRDRAASDKERSRLTDYVKDEVAGGMVDRLLVSPHRLGRAPLTLRVQDIKRRFPSVLDIGCGPGFIAKHLDPEITQSLTMTDSSGTFIIVLQATIRY